VYKSYVWGGDRISKHLLRKDASGKVAESWEISDRDDGMGIVANGAYKGYTLHELMQEMQEDLSGQSFSRFPLLIKWIDAHEDLSIQVHPDEKAAKALHGEPKTEAWYFLEGSSILAGLKEGVGKKALQECIKTGKILELVETIPVKRGDVVFIPAGTIHAIRSGCLLLEIQQNSNTTYRIYDWDRPVKRELHIPQALEAIHLEKRGGGKVSPRGNSLIHCPYFELQEIKTDKLWRSPKEKKSFEIFFLLEGEAKVSVDGNEEELGFARGCLCPAGAEEILVKPKTTCKFLRITL
jgi:mannose-6-phosphate isomerase